MGHADKASALTASTATAFVFSHMPPEVKIIFSGFNIGVKVNSGGRLSSCAPANNPCRKAYIDIDWRDSWDPLTTLVAVRGAAAAFTYECTNCSGHNQVDSQTGDNTWIAGRAVNQTYLQLINATAAGDAIDDLLCQLPKHQSAHAPLVFA